ncbi:MAG: hypothetical protein EBS96_07000 [Spartobacteria bacterium]|nr:hypothetical protein [Spartobacteria bacterium]
MHEQVPLAVWLNSKVMLPVMVVAKLGADESEGSKSSLLLDFRRGAQRVPPVCFGVLFGANRNGGEQAALSPHGRDGHALFLRFKV